MKAYAQDLAASSYWLGVLYQQTQPHEAVKCFREVIKHDPKNADVRSKLRDALAADKAVRELLAEQDRLEAELGAHPERRPLIAEAQLAQGTKLLNDGRNHEATTILRRALAHYDRLTTDAPAIAEHWKGLAGCHRRLGETLHRAGRTAEAEQPVRTALGI